jgi:hypothetical protein
MIGKERIQHAAIELSGIDAVAAGLAPPRGRPGVHPPAHMAHAPSERVTLPDEYPLSNSQAQ